MQMLQTKSPQLELDNSTRSQHLETVERVIRTMRQQLHEPLTLEDMADVACLSPYYFCRVFHQIVGIPPGEFLATLRLDAAKRLLLSTSLSVTEICFEVGYIGLGSFTTRFTQLVGVTPRHLRHLAKNVAISTPSSLLNPETIFRFSLPETGLSGCIHTPFPFTGIIFAGLFPKPIPQASPVACTMLVRPGPFHIDRIPDGRYYLMSAAFPLSEDPHTFLLPGEGVVVGVHGPLLIHNGTAHTSVDLLLRAPRITDPPIISALPYL